MTNNSRQDGFTLIELVVVVAIFGILATLVLAAVQAGRESARRMECAAKLHQLGIAVNNHISVHGKFPSAGDSRGFSQFAMLLPYLDAVPVANALNYSVIALGGENRTVATSALSLLLCPSDALSMHGQSTWTNYAGNAGTGVQKFGYNGVFAPSPSPPVKPADITDGAANTACVAEWLVGSGSRQIDVARSIFRTPVPYVEPDELEKFITACRALEPAPQNFHDGHKGKYWLEAGLRSTSYNHISVINGKSCLNYTSIVYGAYAASSSHGRGANVLFADGAVRFVSETCGDVLWRSYGSRNGVEVISE